MRPLTTSIPVLETLDEAPDVVTPNWIQRACKVTKRQALDAIKTAVRHGVLTRFDRGQYHTRRARVNA